LGRVNVGVVTVKFSHHLHDCLLLTHHLLYNLIEQIIAVFCHLKSLQFLLSLSCLLDQFLVHISFELLLVVWPAIFSPVDQFLQSPHSSVLDVVSPLPVFGVVLLNECVHERLDFILKVCTQSIMARVDLGHDVENNSEVVNVVDALLVNCGLKDKHPDLLIIPT